MNQLASIDRPAPRRVVVMGVAACGKSTVGLALATELKGSFLDADALHPQENIEKMASGNPLMDTDRGSWLQLVGQHLTNSNGDIVIACSALKRSYRDLIREAAPDAFFIHLGGERDLIAHRLSQRPGHFMPPSLLDSQIDTLELLMPDERGVRSDNTGQPTDVAADAARWLPRCESA
jgi:gluconokinase